MESASVDQQPFRFLDLPAELRVWVYNSMEFPNIWHNLHRTEARMDKDHWPDPPKAQVYDSCVTLIRPRVPLEILFTCRLIDKEARPVLEKMMEHFRCQPLRYLTDWGGAHALVRPASALGRWIGLHDMDVNSHESSFLKSFLRLCDSHLSRTRGVQSGSGDPRTVEITIINEGKVKYHPLIFPKALSLLGELRQYDAPRLVVIVGSLHQEIEHSVLKELCTLYVEHLSDSSIRETGSSDQASSKSNVFLRTLTEEAFEKHVESLKWY